MTAPGTTAPAPGPTPAPGPHSTDIPAGASIDAADADGDGLTDAFEKLAGTNINSADTDSDGLSDGYEALSSHTDPLSADTDRDGTPDAAEITAGTDPGRIPGYGGVSGLGDHAQNIRAGALDSDADGLTDPYEISVGSDPMKADTDGDGLADNLEVTFGTSPLSMDTDADGITDGTEIEYGMNPLVMEVGTGPGPVTTPPAVVTAPVPAAAPGALTTTGAMTAAAPIATSGTAGGQVQQMIDLAMKQVGDEYVFGAEVAETDPDPDVWDCAEFTQWSAYQVGSEIPGSSFEQYLALKEQGLLIPVEQALTTPGALLFHFSSEPRAGGGRPDEAHVALSLGNGQTVEAQSTDVGVVTDDADGRFEYAALLPNVDYSGAGDVTPMAAPPDPMPTAADLPDASGLNLDMVVYGIKMQESRGDYQAENPTSTASGAYQYIDGTWDGYGGYDHAADAPPSVQDEKMRADTMAAYERLGDWERVIASHFAGENVQAGPKSDWTKVPGYDYNQNPSIRDYVDGVLGHIGDADPSMFGGFQPVTGPTPPAATTVPVPVDTVPVLDPHLTAQKFVDAALSQRGDAYQFGAEADGQADPTAFDRSELTEWAAGQAGVEIPDGSVAQFLDLKAKGLLIPVGQAAYTPGALLFTFSSEPTADGPRPDVAHVAISQGNGMTVEADDVQGVTVMDIGNRFQYAAVLPGLQATVPTSLPADPLPAPTTDTTTTPTDPDDPPPFQIDPGTAVDDPGADIDLDGLTHQFETMIGTDPTQADSDLDGLLDGMEVSIGTNPLLMDSDLDGYTDGMELRVGTDPLHIDPGPPDPLDGDLVDSGMDLS